MPDALASLRALLDPMGLGSLVDQAAGWIRDGVDPASDEFYQLLRATEEYRVRFAANEQRRAAGLTVLSERQIMDYETTARQMFRAAGLPEGFYDQPEDFVRLLVNDVSASELQRRIEDGYVRVANTDPAIRAVFDEWFVGTAEGAMAAVFLDPQTALPVLQRQVAAAEIGGIGANFGYAIGQNAAMTQAERLDSPSRGQIGAAFTRLAQVRPVFSETVSRRERDDNMSADVEGLGYAFETGDAERVRSRIRQRMADFSGGTRAAVSQRGIIGTGSAR